MDRREFMSGAGAHCRVGAGRLAFARIYDWLDHRALMMAGAGARCRAVSTR